MSRVLLAFLIVAVPTVLLVARLVWIVYRDTHPVPDVAIDDEHELPEIKAFHWQIGRETAAEEEVDHEFGLIERARQQVATRLRRRSRS